MSMRYGCILLLFTIVICADPLTVQIEELPTADLQEKVITPNVLMIDDFEDGELKLFREWWVFDKVLIQAKELENRKYYSGQYGMSISGSSSNWYAGGIGTYLNEDASFFNSIKFVIYSPSVHSGLMRIELYDDDNNNHTVDIDKDKSRPSKDDVFIYDMNLYWLGWKVINVPIRDFIDYNPEVGDNIWNPNQLYGSAGLIQMQIIILSSKYESETIEFVIDTIKFN